MKTGNFLINGFNSRRYNSYIFKGSNHSFSSVSKYRLQYIEKSEISAVDDDWERGVAHSGWHPLCVS